jgi:hypothetical protein
LVVDLNLTIEVPALASTPASVIYQRQDDVMIRLSYWRVQMNRCRDP